MTLIQDFIDWCNLCTQIEVLKKKNCKIYKKGNGAHEKIEFNCDSVINFNIDPTSPMSQPIMAFLKVKKDLMSLPIKSIKDGQSWIKVADKFLFF